MPVSFHPIADDLDAIGPVFVALRTHDHRSAAAIVSRRSPGIYTWDIAGDVNRTASNRVTSVAGACSNAAADLCAALGEDEPAGWTILGRDPEPPDLSTRVEEVERRLDMIPFGDYAPIVLHVEAPSPRRRRFGRRS